jgi:CRISPR/Cas system-associated protein Cas7 (RAMP superfamily)
MPKMKSASSLSDICLVFISQNVKMFCNELEIGKQADVADVTDVEDSTTNPFHQLRKWPIILT